MTTTNTHFTSKEHYMIFRDAWSNSVNSEKAKAQYEIRKRHRYHTITEYTEKTDGWVTGAHHVLYNILRNRPFHRGFTMINRRSKLRAGHMPHLGLSQAVRKLKNIQKLIKQEEKHPETIKKHKVLFPRFNFRKTDEVFWGTNIIDKFLTPFEGTVTRAMLININLPDIIPLYMNFGIGKEVMSKIFFNNLTPQTYDDLLILINEVTQ